MDRKSQIILGIVVVAILLVTGTVIRAQGGNQVRACANCAPPQGGGGLPVIKGPMKVNPVGDALSILQIDDGGCESGLGASTVVTDYHEFDVPTQCIQAGLDIVGLTARMNTGIGTAFAFGQGGPIPPAAGLGSTVAISALAPLGPCPATALSTRAIGPGAAVVTGTANFFAGLITPTGFAGRDSNLPAGGRMWLVCGTCGMTQYSPTDLSGFGLGGDWMIRVTVEDQNCIPVELIGFDVS